MNPKEKATELVYETFRKAIGVSRYYLLRDPEDLKRSKRCALICVDEILKIELMIQNLPLSETKIMMEPYPKFWKKVKEEIQKS